MNDFPSSHGFRLTLRQWAGAALFAAVFVLAAPRVWRALEPLETSKTWRVPYELSADYWLYQRWAERAAATRETLLVGDSVVWGQYVRPGETLADHLNAISGRDGFANLGLDGSHPAALAGLVEHYGGAIRGKNVILHCNLLWMSSPKHDLRDPEEFKFNHKPLVPRFSPWIACDRDDVNTRLGHLVQRNLPFNAWTNHLQAAYFGNAAVPTWTRDHPYENPLAQVTLKIPPPGDALLHESIPWTERGIKKQDLPWMSPAESFQWSRFLRALELLQARDNRVLVVVGPFNEHLLADASLERYRALRDGVARILRERNVAVFVPQVLPSETYGDASHPLSRGYELFARQLLDHEFLKLARSP